MVNKPAAISSMRQWLQHDILGQNNTCLPLSSTHLGTSSNLCRMIISLTSVSHLNMFLFLNVSLQKSPSPHSTNQFSVTCQEARESLNVKSSQHQTCFLEVEIPFLYQSLVYNVSLVSSFP